MSRPFIEKTYPGEAPRPSVEVTRWENDTFLMAATPWGNKDVIKEISESYREFLTASMADREATSPFARIPTLSPIANTLRAATLYANDKACRKINNEAFTSACEAIVIAFENSEMAWIQVGQPHLFLIRKSVLTPLEVAVDLSVDFQMTTPIPGRLIGIDRQIDVSVKSLKFQPEDRFVLLARSTIPQSLFSVDVNQTSEEILKTMFEVTVASESKVPFWISVLG